MTVRRPILACISLMLLAACHGGGTTSSQTGASSPRAAVDAFMGAVKSQNLQAMSEVWGNDKSLARDRIERSELEKRELLMQCYLKHDRYQVLGEVPGKDGRRVLTVRLTRGQVQRELGFETVKGRADRWYVENAELAKVQDLCTDLNVK